jgi:hypothetical protein
VNLWIFTIECGDVRLRYAGAGRISAGKLGE